MGVGSRRDPRRTTCGSTTSTSPAGNGVYVPPGWTGTMPNGDVIKPGVSLPGHPLLVQERPGLAEGRRRTWTAARRRRSRTTGSGRRPPSRVRSADYARLFEGTTPPPVDTTAPSRPDGSARRHHHRDVGHDLVDGLDGQHRWLRRRRVRHLPRHDEGRLLDHHVVHGDRPDRRPRRTRTPSGPRTSRATCPPRRRPSRSPPRPRRPTRPRRASPRASPRARSPQNSLTLSWSASTDNSGGSGMAGYDVYRGTTRVGSTTTTSYSDTGLTAATAYSYTVRAQGRGGEHLRGVERAVGDDPAGHHAGHDRPVGACGPRRDDRHGDQRRPHVDRVHGHGWLGPRRLRRLPGHHQGRHADLGVATPDSGLTAATAYQYTVRARDNAGNVSAASSALSVTTQVRHVDRLPAR